MSGGYDEPIGGAPVEDQVHADFRVADIVTLSRSFEAFEACWSTLSDSSDTIEEISKVHRGDWRAPREMVEGTPWKQELHFAERRWAEMSRWSTKMLDRLVIRRARTVEMLAAKALAGRAADLERGCRDDKGADPADRIFRSIARDLIDPAGLNLGSWANISDALRNERTRRTGS